MSNRLRIAGRESNGIFYAQRQVVSNERREWRQNKRNRKPAQLGSWNDKVLRARLVWVLAIMAVGGILLMVSVGGCSPTGCVEPIVLVGALVLALFSAPILIVVGVLFRIFERRSNSKIEDLLAGKEIELE